MSKRYIFPQQYGERKKAKLDVTVSDHNFPVSQNSGTGKDGDQDNAWGDDKDDEILLLASQVCEDAYNEHNLSEIPNYSMCMQPSSTSTQYFEPVPSTSKSSFTFKKPTSSPMNMVTTKLKDKCERISSPLPGMAKVCNANGINVSDDIIINENKSKQDPDHIYRQLVKLQEENAKLKLENGQLLEKCVTKEGEASILRSQLKNSQIAVDNARLDKMKVQERVQMEWSDKLTAANKQMQELRTQLDFKNLEIISMKEKCKMLESNKVKLTQVTVAANDISMSQRHNSSSQRYHNNSSYRHNNNSYAGNDVIPHYQKVKTTASAVQTERHSHYIKLAVPLREESSQLSHILPLVLTPTTDQCCILDYNEKLRQSSEPSRCRIYSTYHRLPSTPAVCREKRKKINLTCICEGLSKMAACREWTVEDFLQIFKTAKELLEEVQFTLEAVRQRVTTAFQREMDEKYIDASCQLLVVDRRELLEGRALYKEEQAILARRMLAVLAHVLEDSRSERVLHSLLYNCDLKTETDFVNTIHKICTLLDSTTCALPYSGLLSSITLLLKKMINFKAIQKLIIQIIKTIILSRPMPFVACEILHLLTRIPSKSVKEMCCHLPAGNLKIDFDQGVLLYKKDSCVLQVMLKQIEGVLKSTEKARNLEHAVYNTRNLILMYSCIYCDSADDQQENRCECALVHTQVLVYALNVCANMLDTDKCTGDVENETLSDTLSVCLCGMRLLYRCALRDVEFASRLGHNEGHLLRLCELLRRYTRTDIHTSMLSEITSSLQSSPEEQPLAYHARAWLHSFESFTLTD